MIPSIQKQPVNSGQIYVTSDTGVVTTTYQGAIDGVHTLKYRQRGHREDEHGITVEVHNGRLLGVAHARVTAGWLGTPKVEDIVFYGNSAEMRRLLQGTRDNKQMPQSMREYLAAIRAQL